MLDNRLCPQLTAVRSRLDATSSGAAAAFRPLTQLHGWWHVASAVGANFQAQYVAYHRQKITGIGEELEHGLFFIELKKNGENKKNPELQQQTEGKKKIFNGKKDK